MTHKGLASWRRRLRYPQHEAAAALGLPLATYRGIEQGRRYRDRLPLWLVKLTRYVELHGPLPGKER